MSTSMFHDQAEFLMAGDVKTGTVAAENLAFTLINEELDEFFETGTFFPSGQVCETSDSNAIKEALDVVYVMAQYLNVTVGPDKAKELWDALHQNNMSKCVEGKLVKNEQGKILKPENYVPLDIEKLL